MKVVAGARRHRRIGRVLGAMLVLAALLPVAGASVVDPRPGLSPGWLDAGQASSGIELIAHNDKPAGFFNPASIGSLSFANSDIAFSGNYAFAGSFHGFNIYDISNPAAPALRTSVVCPGGQGDMSVYENLLFMSVEETRGRIDCGTQGATGTVNPARFRGVRIFDISNIAAPRQVAAVQTCKGSHTHTLVTDPGDADNVYVYVSGTSGIRSGNELAGCNGNSSLVDPTTANFRIEVIKVPLAAPLNAAIVSTPRIMSTCGSSACVGDFASGALNGLHRGGAQPLVAEGLQAPGGQSVSQTSQCHDITVYAELGLAAGACQGNGILLDISNPVEPVRIDAVADPNFAYWHSATFNNDGTKVIFTDEWGGGTGARCRAANPTSTPPRIADRPNWGANAIFDIVARKLVLRSYYKLPVVQTDRENCVAHNGSIVPVPGRDIMTQAWYQGGLSVLDFSDSANPKELAFFDRGPVSATALVTGGLWSTYYYNGYIYGTEIARGFDAFGLTPTAALTENEIAVAAEPQLTQFNAQLQPRISWAPSYALVRTYRDQLVRANGVDAAQLAQIDKFVDRAERFASGHQQSAAAAQLHALANQLSGAQFDSLRASLEALSATTKPHKAKAKQAAPGASAKARGNSPDHGVDGDADEKLHADQESAE